jgi:hypothetical protein
MFLLRETVRLPKLFWAEFYSDIDILLPNMNRPASLRPALSSYQRHIPLS